MNLQGTKRPAMDDGITVARRACLLCGSHGTRKVVYRDDAVDVVRCEQCGCVFQSAVRVATASDYTCGQRRAGKESEFNEVAAAVRRIKPTGDLLDIGCGTGEFLERMQAEGYAVTGIEPDVAGCDIARERFKLDVVHGYYTKAAFPKASFDVITYIQTLEHLTRPLEALRASYYHLREGGVIAITVPSFNNPRVIAYRITHVKRLVRRDFIPSHLSYFTPRTLRMIVVRAGFRVADVRCGRYSVRYSHVRLPSCTRPLLRLADVLANWFGIGGIALFAQKCSSHAP